MTDARMQSISWSTRHTKGETQPLVFTRQPSGLMLLYGSGTPPRIIRFFERIAGGTTLAPTSLQIDKARRRITPRQAITRLTHNSGAAPHILLCVHGGVAPRSDHRMQLGQHMLGVRDDGIVATRRMLQWVCKDLPATSPDPSGGATGRLPFIHLFSCHSGVLRKQLKPGSALWRSAYVLVYASKRRTSLCASGGAIATAIRYADWCERQRIAVDPLRLMAMAGLRRGECLTLMGGDLSGPLVWHAPKSEADLSDQRSLAMLQGDPSDVARLREHVDRLTPAEIELLPAASLRALLSNRMERDDVDGVRALITEHPEMLNASDAFGETPLIEAAEKRADRCLALLLELGCDPNGVGQLSTPLTMCLAALNYDFGVLELLLAHGADPNLIAPSGHTALMYAIDDEWEAGIQCLLAHGARMDVRDPGGLTCFEDAALNGKSVAIDLMLAAGAGEAEGLNPALIRDVYEAGHTALASTLTAYLQRSDKARSPSA